MLYHVPDRARALSEIRRILKPDGRFYTSTVGEQHLQELGAMLAGVIGRHFFWGDASTERTRHPFTLESGVLELAQWFSQVTISRHEDALMVTEAEPLLAYYIKSV
jgi:SAM-dependent methyltransferase